MGSIKEQFVPYCIIVLWFIIHKRYSEAGPAEGEGQGGFSPPIFLNF